MMGLLVSIYRDDYDSTANVFHGRKRICIVNADGPFDPMPDVPAARIIRGPGSAGPIVVPDEGAWPVGMAGPMFGGTYAATSDSRFREAQTTVTGQSIYGALSIHDRFEAWPR